MPQVSAGVPNREDVAAGAYHTLFLRKDGTVWAWGQNTKGQLGKGTVSTTSTIPLQITGLPPIKAIAAGGSHSLALDGDGHLWVWGDNANGQLGMGSMGATPVTSPVSVDLPGNPTLVTVAAGFMHSMALDTAGAELVPGRAVGRVRLLPHDAVTP
ncbi:RCC1 domain-containing protein [Chondromyces apiculatus]|uniref:RCC1 domain-containing protein n=1 Tax=Chondromyces apiculatus TaxID=51 RepID=UPI0018CC2535|nr:hypothetical protein [Chondromyces apiculatus]